MKKLNIKNCFYMMGSTMVSMALLVTTININTTCAWFAHQPELPDTAKKLRKF